MPSDNAANLPVPESDPSRIVVASPTEQVADEGDQDEIQQLLTDQIVLSREMDGHFYAEVEVNYGKARFLVDTGASMVALTGDDAKELGLDWTEDELQMVGRGASGDVRGKQVMIDHMQIGNFEANAVRAVIIPEGLDVSLLGQSFLARIGSVNIKDNKMVWN